MRKFIIHFVIIASVFISCKSDERYDLIKGKWKCAEWTVNDQPSNRPVDNVFFEFTGYKTYTSVISSQTQQGDFKITDDYIEFFPDNSLEIKVQLMKLNSDSLCFLMNNGGLKEVMTLVKKQE